MTDKPDEKFVDQAANPDVDMDEPVEPKPEFATKEDIAEIKGALEQVTLSMKNFGQPSAPVQNVPEGPGLDEQVAELDKQLSSLDEPFEDAVREGKGVAAIQRKREALIQKRADLIHKTDMEELRTFGTFAIDQLTDEVVKDKLELLRIPEVQHAYDQALSSMTPAQKMNPETRMLAYKFACGENMDKIFDLKLQEHLRQTEEAKTQEPAAAGRQQEVDKSHPDYVPQPDEVLSKENMDAIKFSGKDLETYYQSMGYKGWEDFWKTDGKAYFAGEEEE